MTLEPFKMMFTMISLTLMLIMFLMISAKMMTPLLAGTSLMLYNVYTIIQMNMFTVNFWYSYITFLIMVGGLMIMFMYFSSLSSNINLSLKWKFPLSMMMLMILYIMMTIYMKKLFLASPLISLNNLNLTQPLFLNQVMLMNQHYTKLTVFCFIYLFVALVTILKINLKNNKSIRSLMPQ
uniref:NADH dehydrogenase subunit 6 n=1 Tax=Evania appendigaster TaxID=27486 RepID=C8YLY4_EVAAP|nr:NADH dehydrogenase subunit 6 [Evania appendigaster]ACL36009.1 NADH dehydrogenase subunit 6 [Evania appendigaster]